MKNNSTSPSKKRVLPIIILSQFCCTSTWFAGNSIIEDLITAYNLSTQSLGNISSAVQFGFILGTLLFAFFTVSDRFSPSKIFFSCAIVGAIFNLGMLYSNNTIGTLLVFRFFTGFSLAGIYPVGMKIASDHYKKGLGLSLSFLVGALVLGTSFPYLIKSFNINLNWAFVVWSTSLLSLLGGLLIIVFVGSGPYQELAPRFDASKIINVFNKSSFRAAAFGYFGHMWELYAFWTFTPILLIAYSKLHNVDINIPLMTFIIIASGTFACILGGYIATKFGTKNTAVSALGLSGLCCLLSPLLFSINSSVLFIIILIVWGMAVIADSPLFSTLVTQNCDAHSRGTALTIVNCIGFTITIISIQLLNLFLAQFENPQFIFMILALGPIIGLVYLRKS